MCNQVQDLPSFHYFKLFTGLGLGLRLSFPHWHHRDGGGLHLESECPSRIEHTMGHTMDNG